MEESREDPEVRSGGDSSGVAGLPKLPHIPSAMSSSDSGAAELAFRCLTRLAEARLQRARSGNAPAGDQASQIELIPEQMLESAWRHAVEDEGSSTDRDRFAALTARSLRRLLLTHIRWIRIERSAWSGLTPFVGDSDRSLTALDRVVHVENALRQLEQIDPIRGLAVECRLFGQMTSESIGRVLDCTENDASLAIRSGLAWIRSQLVAST